MYEYTIEISFHQTGENWKKWWREGDDSLEHGRGDSLVKNKQTMNKGMCLWKKRKGDKWREERRRKKGVSWFMKGGVWWRIEKKKAKWREERRRKGGVWFRKENNVGMGWEAK